MTGLNEMNKTQSKEINKIKVNKSSNGYILDSLEIIKEFEKYIIIRVSWHDSLLKTSINQIATLRVSNHGMVSFPHANEPKE
jgi:hypothetical protein